MFGSIQGFLIGFWMIRKHRSKISNVYFILFLFVIGIQLTFKVITKSWLMDEVLLFYISSYQLPFLIGPILFLYIQSWNKDSFSLTHILHFVPFLAAVLMAISYNVRWIGHLHVHPYIYATFQLSSLTIYGIVAYQVSASRFRSFIVTVTVIESIIAATLAVMVVYYGRFPDLRLVFVALTLLIYWISYKLISDQGYFISQQNGKNRSGKYAHSSLKPEESARIETMMTSLLIDKKLFTQSSLSIDGLASQIDTSRHHLSQVINEKLNRTYNEYINELRVEEARERLSDPASLKYTIAAIAHDAGFNSVSTFNEIFKKQYGTTPSQFRDEQLKSVDS